ncbi:hypothetical protein CDL12_25822 [Handroanthus impetiginosus]|uniref:Transmembrane protein n=1 Tax=Handroanthus impetiginosus TaxID=429701 RepID=A0A2G9G8P6_9LAMI|nr:hypothetical protein CDL12_25822 [Handroanthus impetiginosus]
MVYFPLVNRDGWWLHICSISLVFFFLLLLVGLIRKEERNVFLSSTIGGGLMREEERKCFFPSIVGGFGERARRKCFSAFSITVAYGVN